MNETEGLTQCELPDDGPWDKLQQLGIKSLASIGSRKSCRVSLPRGWSTTPAAGAKWSNILDAEGMLVVSVHYREPEYCRDPFFVVHTPPGEHDDVRFTKSEERMPMDSVPGAKKALKAAVDRLHQLVHMCVDDSDVIEAAHVVNVASQNLTLSWADFYTKNVAPATSRPVDPTHDGGPKTPTLSEFWHALAVEDGCAPDCLVETKFTKGPLKLREWADAPDYTTIRIMDAAEGIWIGESSSLYSPRLGYRKEEVQANALLWAASPKLFAACQAAYVRLLSLGQYRGRISTAGQRELSDLRDALAKAVDARAVEIQDSAEALATNMKAAEAGRAPSREEQDAHLLDAAPDMYAAGRAVVASWEKGDLAGAVRALAAALVKADGGTP